MSESHTYEVYIKYYLLVTLHTIITQLCQEAGNLDGKSCSSLHGLVGTCHPRGARKWSIMIKGHSRGVKGSIIRFWTIEGNYN